MKPADEWTAGAGVRVRGCAAIAAILIGAGLLSACTPVPGSPEDLARFEDRVVFSGLEKPTALAFAPDGRVFVAEQSGLIKVFDSVDDPSPAIFADLRTNVHNFWDRGILGLAVDPQFPARPYVYVSYTYDAAIGGAAPRWGTAGQTSDPCPTPPGATANGCVVSGRVSRLTASGNAAASEAVLVNDWCQQFPSHSMGALVFGPDGALYVSAGEGASFGFVDWGQRGNPCGDPDLEGGALRAQDLRTTSDPTGLSGAVLRLDPNTGAAMPGNPLIGSSDPNIRRIIAYGLRNPFRFTFQPGTRELWIGDDGAADYDEVNRIPDVRDAVVENLGWPCYEGPDRQSGFDAADLPLCEALFAAPGTVTAPFTYYHHFDDIAEGCEVLGTAVSGLAFYQGGSYPPGYAGALFVADYARNCIWMMLARPNGVPDPATRRFFAKVSSPVDLQIGPGGDLFYVSYWEGTINRFVYVENRTPTAVIAADPTAGPSPLTVTFDGSGSLDPDAAERLLYAWDLDGDGQFDDGTAPTASWTYATAGVHQPALKVTDRLGATDTATITITVDNSYPAVTIDTPPPTQAWTVGDTISFSGHATDGQDGDLAPSALSWSLVLAHCSVSGCHDHRLQDFLHTASGTFVAPDHEYPSHLRLAVTATDSSGLQSNATVILQPLPVDISFASDPAGIELSVGSVTKPTPFALRLIRGASTSVGAPATVVHDAKTYDFVSWSDGGDRNHIIVADEPRTLTATYQRR